MKRITTFAVLGALALGTPLGAQEVQPTSGQAAPAPAPKPYEDIIKLWKANLSEDFIKRQIENGTTIYGLSAEDIIRCRDAGLPESLIETMIKTTSRGTAGSVAPAGPGNRPVGAPNVTPAGAPGAPAAAPVAPPAIMRWEGLARRTTGLVLKSRWKDAGYLEYKEETLRWVDADEPDKNLLVPMKSVSEQFLTCLKKAGGNECFEWGFKTRDAEYRFRDISWEQNENDKVAKIYEYLQAVSPSLISSKVPVDQK